MNQMRLWRFHWKALVARPGASFLIPSEMQSQFYIISWNSQWLINWNYYWIIYKWCPYTALTALTALLHCSALQWAAANKNHKSFTEVENLSGGCGVVCIHQNITWRLSSSVELLQSHCCFRATYWSTNRLVNFSPSENHYQQWKVFAI